MIANACSVVIGIWLVYAAVLNPVLISQGRRAELVALLVAIVLVGLALIARRAAYDPWHSNVQIALSALLVLQTLIEFTAVIPDVVTFWITFWVGLLVAFVALWAILYKPRDDHAPG